MFRKSNYNKPPKLCQRGFTLIELLIVVAILGALAAVVIPYVGRFIGRGEAEAKDTEFSNIQAAVTSMMVDNQIATLPNPVALEANRVNDMNYFPDTSANGVDKVMDIYGNTFSGFSDKAGYILYGHDRLADGSKTTDLANYLSTSNTTYWYTVDSSGTVTQYDTAP